jgi:hypothetical protein
MEVHKIEFMVRRTVPILALAVFAVVLLSCSEAPEVPIQGTNRRVLAELVSEVG